MTFARDIAQWAKKAGLNAEEAVRVTCHTLNQDIILASPVDTGRFRGNWQGTIASAASSTLDTDDKSGSGTLTKANAAADQSVGSVYYLVNNLPYARRLEYGYSSKAPQGMVRVAVQNFQAAVAAAARKANK